MRQAMEFQESHEPGVMDLNTHDPKGDDESSPNGISTGVIR
jgi:hypothetical protein